MRTLMWLTLGFVAACCAGICFFLGSWLLLVAGICVLLILLLWLIWRKRAGIPIVFLCGVLVGSVWVYGYDLLYLSPITGHDGKTLTTSIEVIDYSYETAYGIAVDGKIPVEGKNYRVRVYMDAMDMLKPGDTISGDFRLRVTVRGAIEESIYHQGNGIFLLAYAVDEVTAQRCVQEPVKYFAAKIRRTLQMTIDAAFPEDTAAFARALLLGDSTKLSYQENTNFKISGIRHMIAVSGLHVSILFSLVYMLCVHKRWPTAIFGIPVLILFAAVAGFTPSIVRACVMQILMILAMLVYEEYDPPTALSLSVLIMVMVNPMVITSVSLQLSVSCMIGIFLFSSRISEYLKEKFHVPKTKKRLRWLAAWFSGSVGVSVSAMTLTIPLCAWYFGTVSIVSVITNLLTLSVVSFVFYGIMLSCGLGLIWPAAAKAVASVVSWMIRYIKLIASAVASIPWSAVYTCSIYIVLWLAFAYVLFLVFLLSKKKRPWFLAICMFAGLCMALLASYGEPALDRLRVTVMDVGQGQCILFQTKEGNYIVDCGGSDCESAADTAAQTLLSQGIFHLDGVILTHYDKDHAGGVPLLLTRLDADALYLPDMEDDGNYKEQLSRDYGDRITWVSADMTFGEACKFKLFAGKSGKSENESGLCVLFQGENCDILITGDRSSSGERELVERVELPQLEMLVAGHHGSNSSTGFPLLSETRPQMVAISVEKDNRYGHPAEALLDRLERFGCRIWRTDRDGTLIFRR